MKEHDANELLVHLLDLAAEQDHAGIEAEELPTGAAMVLRKLVSLNQEIQSLESLVARKEADADQVEQLLLQQLMQLP